MRTVSRIAVTRCLNYESAAVHSAVSGAIGLLGGIDKFVRPSSRVLVKPNLLMAVAPDSGIVTHPEVVRSVVRQLKGIKCRVFLGDGPSIWGKQAQNTDRVYETTGMKRLAEEENIELVRFDKQRMFGQLALTEWLCECDFLVNIPKFKTHTLMLLSGGIKNLFGLVSEQHKSELHRRYLQQKEFAGVLADIYAVAKPALTVIDGITAIEGDGPGTSGSVRRQGVILAGVDCVALDSALAFIMGVKPEKVFTNLAASRRGLGTCDLSAVEVLGQPLASVSGRPFDLPVTSFAARIPLFLLEPLRILMRFKPQVRTRVCSACGRCQQICPVKAISLKGKYASVDYSRCISCFCCQETCPNRAIRIKKNLFARLAGL